MDKRLVGSLTSTILLEGNRGSLSASLLREGLDASIW
ncbi:hypothetical protein MRX96_051850, partial [Rhipicephalus microplus]